MNADLLDALTVEADTRIIYLIIDGLGGLEMDGKGGTELQVADTPNLDLLAERSACGLLVPIAPGITPGSGPSHLALFGYDPMDNDIGRGILSALGVGFKLTERDVAARVNFATVDERGRITDRRAGRIKSETNNRLCEKILKGINLGPDVEVFLETERDHRAALIFRGDDLYGDIHDTDPQRTGVRPLEPKAVSEEAGPTASLIKRFISQAGEILADEHPANMILLRGFAKYRPLKTLKERFKLNSLAIANYPMYQGFGRLIGMDIHPAQKDIPAQFKALKENYNKYDFIFLHIKTTDSRGEDGDFDGKVNVLEEVDRLLPQIIELKPDVLVVTGDHSTPARLAGHSWHTVPLILSSPYARRDKVYRFDEVSCTSGSLVNLPAVSLMPLALANALRLTKYGA